MNVRTIFLLFAAVMVLAVAGCATDGMALTEVGDGLDDYSGSEVSASGEVGRGVPVSGTELSVYQFGDDEQTVAVLSTETPQDGDSRNVTGRVVPFTGDAETLEDEEDGVRDSIESYLEESGVSEEALEAATDQSFELVRTFTIANAATFFLLEE